MERGHVAVPGLGGIRMSSDPPSHLQGGSAGLRPTLQEDRFSPRERLVIIIGIVLLGVTVCLDVIWFPHQGIQTNAAIFASEAEAWVALAIFVEAWFAYQNWLQSRREPIGTVGPPIVPPIGNSTPPVSQLGPESGGPSIELRSDQMDQRQGGQVG